MEENGLVIEYKIIGSTSKKRQCPTITTTTIINEQKQETEDDLIKQEWPSEPTFLQALNSHPFDWRVKFNPELHVYYTFYEESGSHTSQFNLSASGFYKQYFRPFNNDEILDNYKFPGGKCSNPKYKGLTRQDIKDKWKSDADKGAHKGTFYHLLLENHCNQFNLAESKYANLIPIQQYLTWRKDIFDPEFKEFRTEMRFHSPIDLRIVGTADLIAIRRNHPPPEETNGVLTLSIFDWKNTKDLKKIDTFHNPPLYGLGPCSGIPDCNFGHYCIQQNIYKWLLETYYKCWTYNGLKYTSVKVEFMKLIIIHENNKDNKVQEEEVPDYSDIIAKMVLERRKNLKKLMEEEKEKSPSL